MTEFTPGPWSCDKNQSFDSYIRAGKKGLAKVMDTNLANAQLIAAAPELLSCLEAINATINAGHLKFSDLIKREGREMSIRDSILQAIARAYGREVH